MSEDPTIGADETYTLDDQIGYILRMANQRHVAIFQTHAPGGLTPTQFSALIRLVERGACSQNHLGRLTSMDVATIKGVVDRLKRKGLVLLEPDPTDGRRTIIRPSKAAMDMIDALREAGHRISQATLAPLSASEQFTLLRLLHKIT